MPDALNCDIVHIKFERSPWPQSLRTEFRCNARDATTQHWQNIVWTCSRLSVLWKRIMAFDTEIDAGFQMVYVTKLAVLRGLIIIVTLRAGIQAYGEKRVLGKLRMAQEHEKTGVLRKLRMVQKHEL